LIKGVAGTTGAPTYVMTDATGEITCQPYPKPDDPLLKTIITEASGKE
jgi:hypothetical protein